MLISSALRREALQSPAPARDLFPHVGNISVKRAGAAPSPCCAPGRLPPAHAAGARLVVHVASFISAALRRARFQAADDFGAAASLNAQAAFVMQARPSRGVSRGRFAAAKSLLNRREPVMLYGFTK